MFKNKILFAVFLICLISFNSSFASGKIVGEVDCIRRIMNGNDVIKVIRIEDPDNPFISIFFTTIKSGQIFASADPSNTSIAARLTGEIQVDQSGNRIINTATNLNISSISKSIGSKVMKIARFYDKEKDTLIYLVYTTKILDGSLKHSISVVPLGKPLNQ